MKTRIFFLDNLRTFLIFLVILLHAGIVYESILENTWIVSDPVKNSSIGLVRMYLDLFIMFIMFFISGYFVAHSVKGKTSLEFVKLKFNRIMIPWALAVFTLIPLYKVIFLYSRGLPQEEWYSYFHLFSRVGSDLSNFGHNPTQSWLWFLPVLFMFQVVYLALSKFRLLPSKISLKGGVLLTFYLGLVYSMIVSALNLTGWYHSALLHFQNERLLVYFMVFLLGTLSYKLKVFDSSQKNKKLYIWANITLSVSLTVFTVVALNLFFNMIDPGRNYYFVSDIVDRIAYYATMLTSMLSFLYVLVYVFRFNFNKSNALMDQLNKGSYQVYIIHIIVMGVFALVLLDVTIPAFSKYMILTVLTFVVSNAIVYAYNRLFQYNTTLKIVGATICLFAFVSITLSLKSNEIDKNEEQQEVLHSVPNVGLHEAIISGDIEAVQQHINVGSNLNEKELTGGSSPLITAAVFGKTEIASALINAGADINQKNNDGSTPLHTAAFFCRTEIVKVLLASGADKTLRNNAGSTALESVLFPFDAVKGYYDYFNNSLGPLGLELGYEEIKTTRPIIAKMLQE